MKYSYFICFLRNEHPLLHNSYISLQSWFEQMQQYMSGFCPNPVFMSQKKLCKVLIALDRWTVKIIAIFIIIQDILQIRKVLAPCLVSIIFLVFQGTVKIWPPPPFSVTNPHMNHWFTHASTIFAYKSGEKVKREIKRGFCETFSYIVTKWINNYLCAKL